MFLGTNLDASNITDSLHCMPYTTLKGIMERLKEHKHKQGADGFISAFAAYCIIRQVDMRQNERHQYEKVLLQTDDNIKTVSV